MRKESQAIDKCSDLVRSVGGPRVMVTDNTRTMTEKNNLLHNKPLHQKNNQ